MTVSLQGPPALTRAVEDLVRAVFPKGTEEQVDIEIQDHTSGSLLAVTCGVNGQFSGGAEADRTAEVSKELKRVARVAFVKALEKFKPGIRLPWGILTGIRPTKILHRLLDQGVALQEIREVLAERYLIAPEKIVLALEVAGLQRQYLPSPGQETKLVSIYVGIPFCPSRCSYCSFAGHVGQGRRLDNYLLVLKEEILALGEALEQRSIGVRTIYLGGGTPTILDPGELEDLLAHCFERLASEQTLEVTVEAGRPDTLDAAKLKLMKNAGVTRLSINPQTMVERTLQCIGRNHTPGQVVESFQLARELGFANINMDIILGLPGETLEDVKYTLGELARLEPDSLTVHALAVKRASRLREELEKSGVFFGSEGVSMQEEAARAAESMGMKPYYLYRQKQILNNLENVGYAKPSKESIYNIDIMEERRFIFGVGAGAASKLVNPADWSLVNQQHPKNLEAYCLGWKESLQAKIQLLDRYKSQI